MKCVWECLSTCHTCDGLAIPVVILPNHVRGLTDEGWVKWTSFSCILRMWKKFSRAQLPYCRRYRCGERCLAMAGQSPDFRTTYLWRLHHWPFLDPNCCTLLPDVSACASFIVCTYSSLCGPLRKQHKTKHDDRSSLCLTAFTDPLTLHVGGCMQVMWAWPKWVLVLPIQLRKLLATKDIIHLLLTMTSLFWSLVHRWHLPVSSPQNFPYFSAERWGLLQVNRFPWSYFFLRNSERSVSPQHGCGPFCRTSGLDYRMGGLALIR